MSGESLPGGKQTPVDYDPFSGAPLERVVPTTEPQREIWLADRLGREASLAYNESITIRFSGQLDLVALRSALQDLVQRHQALRCTFGTNGEELCIATHGVLDLAEVDLSSSDELAQQTAIAAAKERAVHAPFVLESGPLVRSEILQLGSAESLVILTAHHAVCDGWSFGVLVRDLMALYAHQVGIAAEAPAPAPSFGDYAVAQHSALAGKQAMEDESYWLARFHGAVPILDLPVDHPRGAWRTFESRREDYTLDAALVTELRKLGGQNGAGIFATSLGLFAALLQRLSGEEDLVVGIPAAGQSAEGFGSLVGHCVHLLPLRLQLDPSQTVAELIAATQGVVLDAYEHRAYTMGSLLQKLAVARDPSRPPLISVMFNIDREMDVGHDCPGLHLKIEGSPRAYEIFEIFVNAVEENGELRLECQYNATLFDAATIRGWLRCYEMLLRSACAATHAAVGTLVVVSPVDQELLEDWNDTRCDFAGGSLVHELFEEQVARAPSRPAVMWRDATMTYADVDMRANQIAHALQSVGVNRGELVGLHVERCPDLIAVMLAVLKIGAAYLPLDPTYPRERLTFMVDDAGLAAVVSTDSAGRGLLPRERCLLLDADDELIAGQSSAPVLLDTGGAEPDDLAYVIYTSGSTGMPNGVCVPHRAVVNFLKSMAREPGIAPDDRLVAVTTPSFDIALNELLLPLTVGATTVLATREEATDGAMLCRLIESSAATMLQATPATWRLLIGAGWRGTPRFKALCGGEELTAKLAEQLLEVTGDLWNMYGPTETTVWSSVAHIAGPHSNISIGRAIANTCIWILDDQDRLCPIGVPGEVCIGGQGVAQGYLDRPELTAARFVPDPMSSTPGARMYRTGDRGRWRTGGVLQHLGRFDFQVKVRGYRIELGEIESRLVSHSSVDTAVAIVREDCPGDVRLVAYYVAKSGGVPAVGELRAHMAEALPNYMVPQAMICLRELPLLPNGKLDRKSLPAPEAQRQSWTDFLAPASDRERGVAEDMEIVLGMSGIGLHDDFFTLGGHSLLAAQLTYRLNSRFDAGLSMRAVFEGPTVAQLAAFIEESPAAATEHRECIARLSDQSRAPASVMQERLWLLEQLNPGRVVYHTPSAHRLTGALQEDAFQRAFDTVVSRQPSLRTDFDNHRHGLDQRVHDNVSVSLIPVEDLSHVPYPEREALLRQRLDELTAETFDLSCAPLFKVRMFRLEDEEHVFFFMPHHIIWDGWSFDLLYHEMSELYAAYAAGGDDPLPPLEVSYGDFAAWHREWLMGAECQQQIDFWLKRMLQAGSARPLPADTERGSTMSGEGATEWLSIARDKSEALHELATQSGATQFAATLTVFSVLLHDFARDSHLVIGTPVRARSVAEVEAIMGYFNNLLLLPIEVKPSESFVTLLERVKASVVESFAMPGVPLEQLERAMTEANGKSQQSPYQALFSFQDVRQRATRWGGLQHAMIPLFQRGTTEDLGMWFVESVDGLQGGLTYNTDVFQASTAQWLGQRYTVLLDRILAKPEASVAEIVGTPPPAVARRIAARDSAEVVAPPVEEGTAQPQMVSAGRQAITGDLEAQILAIWRRVLGVDRVGPTDSFFELGGNSLSVINMVTEVERSLGIRIDPGLLVRTPTIAGLVTSLASPSASRLPEIVVLRPGGPRKLFLVHDGEGTTLPYLNLARLLPADVTVCGIEPPSHPRVPLAMTSIVEMGTCYLEHVQRLQPHGPYLLGGLCAGGLVAYEMAVQLQARGEQVAFVAILDAGTPQAAIKPGLQALWRRERFVRAMTAVRASAGSASMRAWKQSITLVDRVFGALSWAVSSRLARVWAWARVGMLRRLLRSGKPWPTWLPALTFHEIYVSAEACYVPKKLPGCKVVLLRPRPGGAVTPGDGVSLIDDMPYAEIYADQTLGWRDVVDELTIVDVDGGHSSMLWEPHVHSLVAALAPLTSGESVLQPADNAGALDS